jgi:ribosomal protein S15P/S13E
MKKKDQFKPVSDIDNIYQAVKISPLQPGDSRYTDCSKMRGSNTVKTIERNLKRWDEEYFHLLFTGYRGNGKTTELFQLQTGFQKDYEVFYYDASENLDLFNCKMTDIMMAIAKEIHEQMKAAGYPLPDKILKDVADWFFEKILEREKSIKAEAGARAEISSPKWFGFITAKIFAAMKLETKNRQIMRRKLENNLPSLIEKINILLQHAEEKLKDHGKKSLIFIIDSLDRLKEGIDKELFMANGGFFKQLKGNFIFVVPISLLYNEQARLLEFEHEILPMIPVFKNGTDHIPHENNIQSLKDLIGKRIVPDAIFTNPEDSLRELILTSGGHLRDLLRLLQYALGQTDDRIQPAQVEYAMNRLMTDYEKVVKDDQYELLVKVYCEQAAPNDAVSQKLIYNNVILVYQKEDGTELKDLHPAVVRNKKFQKYLKDKEL